MSADILAFMADYGPVAIAILLAAGQFGVPLPTSLALITAGALAAAGDTDLVTSALLALAGAVSGDQAGFYAGRLINNATGLSGNRAGKGKNSNRLSRAVSKATPLVDRYGATGVFFTRWLVTPLGPAVNVAAGAGGLSWPRFTLAATTGEIIWVAAYIGLGYGFAANVEALAGLIGNLSLGVAALTVAVYLGYRLVKVPTRP